MRDSPPGPAADEITVRTQARTVSSSSSVGGRQKWRWWGGAAFAVVLLAIFGQPLLSLIRYAAGSELYSYTLLIPFVTGYLLYVRRDQLPKHYTTDLPMAVVFLSGGSESSCSLSGSISLDKAWRVVSESCY